MRPKRWNIDILRTAVRESESIRQVILKLGLIPAGGNYEQIERAISEHKISTSHFLGQAIHRGKIIPRKPLYPLEKLLVKGGTFQSHKLKRRLYSAGIKQEQCELCGWKSRASDGRIPLELDHMNGDHHDNRIENLRILCPNCHSLQSTHRGKNKRKMRG